MSPTHATEHADPYPSYRAGIAARTLESRLTGTLFAAGFASLLLIAVAVTSNDIQASADMAKARVWHMVSTVLCGSHLDTVSLVGPGCGTATP